MGGPGTARRRASGAGGHDFMLKIFLVAILVLFLIFVAGALCGLTDMHFHKRFRPSRTHVACVGDSVTYGCKLPGAFWRNYPAKLQKRLGERYHVENFALSDRCVQESANKPYRAYRSFQDSKNFQPDIVVIELGANDAKDINWQTPDEFRYQYISLVQDYRELPEHPEVVLCTPTAAFQKLIKSQKPYVLTISLDVLREIAEIVREVGEELELPVVDLYAKTQEHPEWFLFDGLHPNGKGCKVIAEEVFQEIIKFVK